MSIARLQLRVQTEVGEGGVVLALYIDHSNELAVLALVWWAQGVHLQRLAGLAVG